VWFAESRCYFDPVFLGIDRANGRVPFVGCAAEGQVDPKEAPKGLHKLDAIDGVAILGGKTRDC
jgi:hypothetical protein